MTDTEKELQKQLDGANVKEVDEENFKNPHAQANKRLVDDAYHSVLEWVLGRRIKWLWLCIIALCYIISNINFEKLEFNNKYVILLVDFCNSLLNIAFTTTMLLIIFPASSKLRESAIKLFQKWVDKKL